MKDMDLPYPESDKDSEELSQKATHRNIRRDKRKDQVFQVNNN